VSDFRDRIVTFDSKEEWLAFKRTTISATDVIAIVGLPYFGRTAMSVFMDKVDPDYGDESSAAMSRGTAMEPFLVSAYAERTGVELLDVPRWWCVTHPTLPWLSCSPDQAWADYRRNVEAKTSRTRRGWQDPREAPDGVPEAYIVQCAIQTACCETEGADLVAAVGSLDDFRIYDGLHRNARLEKALIARATEFYENHLKPEVFPEWDGSEGADRLLRSLFPHNTTTDQLREVDDEERAVVDYFYLDAQARMRAEHSESIWAQRVQSIIGDSPGICGPGFKITWKIQGSGRVFRPTFYEDFTPTTEETDEHE